MEANNDDELAWLSGKTLFREFYLLIFTILVYTWSTTRYISSKFHTRSMAANASLPQGSQVSYNLKNNDYPFASTAVTSGTTAAVVICERKCF